MRVASSCEPHFSQLATRNSQLIMDPESEKRAVATRATEFVKDGMAVGLGTGSTAEHAVRDLAERVAHGLDIVGVPTSEKIARLARELGIPITSLEERPLLDITLDGADEMDLVTFNAIKGRGGALLREKLVALASRVETIMVDETKVVQRLGERAFLPVEVVTFGWANTRKAVAALGCEPKLRLAADGRPFVTDSGNYLLDCHFPSIDDPTSLAAEIKGITGVVEHGLFIGLIHRVIVARAGSIEVIER